MSAKIIDGKKISAKLQLDMKKEIENLKKFGLIPGLAVIMVGDNEASKIYVRNKELACKNIGIYSEKYQLDGKTSEVDLLNLIKKLNVKPNVHGILVQLPLPDHIDENKIIDVISCHKDVDGFNPYNVGKLMIGQKGLMSCTPQGIIELLNSQNILLKGKECVVIGSSNIVGKPMAMMLVNHGCTVTICNKYTKDIAKFCKTADIVISAAGKAKLIKADMIKSGAVVIDVGMNRDKDGKLCGDVDFEYVKDIAGYITPVPGGVGPMTVTMLLKNTILSAKAFLRKDKNSYGIMEYKKY